MASQNNLYVTQSGMAVKPVRAAFLRILGVDFIFKTLNARAYQKLQDALIQGVIGPDTKLMHFEVGGHASETG